MKHVTTYWKSITGAGVMLAVIGLAAAGPVKGNQSKPKPYPLKTCIVSGEKLDADMGPAHGITYQDREI